MLKLSLYALNSYPNFRKEGYKMLLGLLGSTELLLILVVALVIFGGSRLSGIGKSLGKSIREFKEEINIKEESEEEKK